MKKTQYDKFTKKYFQQRYNKKEFNFNRLIEIPCMIKTIGNVKDKKILDLGCGFGGHTTYYLKKGAKKVIGVDISNKLIDIAKSRNIKNAEFYYGDMNKKLKFKNNSFDIVSASLCVYYVKNLNRLFKEVNRILKRNGVFIFSTGNPVYDSAKNEFNPPNLKLRKIFGFQTLKNGKRIIFGNYFDESERTENWEHNLKVSFYKFTYETYIKTLIKNNFEIIDYVDCKPIKEAKKINKSRYRRLLKLPSFCIFKSRKK